MKPFHQAVAGTSRTALEELLSVLTRCKDGAA